MSFIFIIISLSIVFQLVAAFYSFKLLLLPGRRVAGFLALTIIILMAFRRFISLYRAATGDMLKIDLPAESVALIISLLLLGGILYLTRLIRSERNMASLLEDSRRHYHALFNQSPDGVLLIDKGGRILEFNDTAARDLGYTREEFSSLHLSDIDPVETREDIQGRIEEVITKGKAEFQVKHRTKGGDVRDVQVITQTVELAGEKVFHTIWRDITERLRSEKALLESEARYRDLFENAGDAVFILDSQLRFVDVNKKGIELLGYTPEELRGRQPFDFMPGEQRPLSAAEFEKLKRTGSYKAFEGRLLTKGGCPVDIEVNSTAIFREGAFAGSRDIVRDITARKQAERALQEKENFLQTIIETEPECIKLVAADGSLLMMNRAGLAMIEADSLAQVKGGCLYPLVSPEYREAFKSVTEDVFKGKSGTLEFEAVGLKGRRIRLETHAVPLRNDKNEIIALLGVTRDITERKRAEEALRQKEEMMRNLLDSVDEGFIVIDRDYRIVSTNRAYCQQVGADPADVLGKHCYEISHRAEKPCFENGEECATRLVFETSEPHVSVHRHRDRGGEIIYVETKAFPLRDSSGNVSSVIEVINNITEKQLIEEQHLKTQKLEAVGTLAGGIAHDFNNLLQGVFGYISVAKMNVNQTQKCLEMLSQAEQALQMSVNLTTQLLTFSKGGKPVRKKIDLRFVAENAVRFSLSGSKVDYHIAFDPELRKVYADEGQIGQVIQNMVLNADQAMPGGGTVEIAARNVRAPQRGLPPSLAPGNYVEIALRDNGIGIPKENLSKIFDPYFTTKDTGSGLGLATSYSIIKNHGGAIDVKTEPGRGSTFSFWLPAVEADEKKSESVAVSGTVAEKCRILVMDDEELLRHITKDMIEALGHEAEVTENGEEALAVYRESLTSGRKFDMVILDLTIRGGMGGVETITALREMDPGVRAVVSSGYADSSAVSEYRTLGFMACLTKPYTIDALSDTLSRLTQ